MIYFRVQREEGTKKKSQPPVIMPACMPVHSPLALAHAHDACLPVLSPLALAHADAASLPVPSQLPFAHAHGTCLPAPSPTLSPLPTPTLSPTTASLPHKPRNCVTATSPQVAHDILEHCGPPLCTGCSAVYGWGCLVVPQREQHGVLAALWLQCGQSAGTPSVF